jgi:hypothetical protein
MARSRAFGPLVAAEAHGRNFYAARRRAFVADGQAYNWSIQRGYFADFVPIVDLLHVVCYLFQAAQAVEVEAERWPLYLRWLQSCWRGQAAEVAAQRERYRELAPHGEPRTLRDVARRLRQRGYTFVALSGDLGLSREEHDPAFFETCALIDRCFHYRRFGWVAVVAANDEERARSPLGSFYIFDGAHKSLVLAKRLVAGETTYRPVEALLLLPRR